MHYRPGVENPRNIIRVHDDGREEPYATVYDPADAAHTIEALNALTGRNVRAAGDAFAHGVGVVVQSTTDATGRVVDQTTRAGHGSTVYQAGRDLRLG